MTVESPKFEKKKINLTKKLRLNKLKKRMDEITDKLGMPIDPEIKEAVVAFNIWKFPTSQSCEGHFHKEGASFPWVEVYTPEPKGWEKDEKIQKEWTVENLRQKKRMTEMLSEFYKDRQTPFDARLSFMNIGAYGAFRVQSIGAEMIELFSKEKQKKKQEIYRKEMNDFAKFLKDKFLGE